MIWLMMLLMAVDGTSLQETPPTTWRVRTNLLKAEEFENGHTENVFKCRRHDQCWPSVRGTLMPLTESAVLHSHQESFIPTELLRMTVCDTVCLPQGETECPTSFPTKRCTYLKSPQVFSKIQ